jgi:N-acylneuraminate cytidylyltransferase
LSDDFTGTTEVIAHAIELLELENASEILVCCVYPTAVLMMPEDLNKSLKTIEDGDWEFVFAGARLASPPLRSFAREKSGGVKMLFPEFWPSRSQDLPECFGDAGFFYWSRADNWKNGHEIFGANSTFVEIPDFRAIDINTEADWKHAEMVYEHLRKERGE